MSRRKLLQIPLLNFGAFFILMIFFFELSTSIISQTTKKKTDFRIGVKVGLVAMDVTVLDEKGGPVPNLGISDFKIFDEGMPQEITLFSKADLPITIGIILDTSGSMRTKIDFVTDGIMSFLSKSNRENEVFIVDFSHDKAELLLDFTQDIDDVRDAIKEKMITGGGTPLWDALFLAIDHSRKGKFERKAVMVVSDGEDKDSHTNYADLLQLVRNNDIQIFFVGVLDKDTNSLFDLGSMSRDAAGRDIRELTSDSGGRCYFPENLDQLGNNIEALAIELRQQYRLGFQPQSSIHNKGFRKIQVKILRPGDYKIRTRKGYIYTE